MDVYVSYATKALKARGGNTNTAIFFILIIIKMLVYQTDYLTIDSRRNDCNGEWYSSLLLTITIQCNGKIRRSEHTLQVKNYNDTDMGSSERVEWRWLLEYSVLQIFDLIRNMGYEVADWMKIIKRALNQWYNENPEISAKYLEPMPN
jgi:hypothetical protein